MGGKKYSFTNGEMNQDRYSDKIKFNGKYKKRSNSEIPYACT